MNALRRHSLGSREAVEHHSFRVPCALGENGYHFIVVVAGSHGLILQLASLTEDGQPGCKGEAAKSGDSVGRLGGQSCTAVLKKMREQLKDGERYQSWSDSIPSNLTNVMSELVKKSNGWKELKAKEYAPHLEADRVSMKIHIANGLSEIASKAAGFRLNISENNAATRELSLRAGRGMVARKVAGGRWVFDEEAILNVADEMPGQTHCHACPTVVKPKRGASTAGQQTETKYKYAYSRHLNSKEHAQNVLAGVRRAIAALSRLGRRVP